MARIKIKDLPKDRKISKEGMKQIIGGMALTINSTGSALAFTPISPGHRYTVLGTYTNSGGNQYVALRNPWGTSG